MSFKNWVYKHEKLLYFMSFMRRTLAKSWMLINWVFPVDPDCVVIMNFYGKGFGDSGKAVALKLLEMRPNLKIYWPVKPQYAESIPAPIKPLKIRSLKYYRTMAIASVWIDNARKSNDIIKRKGQFYIQMWHGLLGLKKVEKDAEESLSRAYIREAKDDSRLADIMLSDGDFFTNLIRTSFWYDGDILKSGTPRLDTVINATENEKKQIKENLGVAEKNFLLYAPTFRVNYGVEKYDLAFDKVLQHLGEDWVVGVRLHPNVSEKAKNLCFSERVINLTDYPDLYQLLICTDMLITDYSSVMFDAAVVGIPVLLYTSDRMQYMKDRKFYFDFSELPFELCEDNNSIIEAISRFDLIEYEQKVKSFFAKHQITEDGHASDRVAEVILSHIDALEET